jgi:ferredoxin
MNLKTFRITVATPVFVAFCLIFIIQEPWTLTIADYLTATQFIPSLIQFISGHWASLGFVAILVATLLCGRIYCSFLCPLGILQDVVIYLRKLLRRLSHSKPASARIKRSKTWLQYPLLLFMAVAMASGFLVGATLLDPYSVFGRIGEQCIKPVFASFYNLLVSILELYDIYALSAIEVLPWDTTAFVGAASLGLLVVLYAAVEGRGYCNNICPVGTFLGLLSRFSLWRIHISNKCKHCKVCAPACKANCLDLEHEEVVHENCVACFNCLAVCRFSALSYTRSGKRQPAPELPPAAPDVSRRRFMLKSFTGLAGITGIAAGELALYAWHEDELEGMEIGESRPVLPPGAREVHSFTSRCTACQLCVAQCPGKVLRPAFLELGVAGMLQPILDYRRGFCEYECNRCSQVCPTKAIEPLPISEKKETQIGIAKLIEKECIVFKHKKDCGACAEHCPTHAVVMVPYENRLYAPQLNDKRCIGCGVCEHACPTNPRAIIVEGKLHHGPVPEKAPANELPPPLNPQGPDLDFDPTAEPDATEPPVTNPPTNNDFPF